MWQAVVRGGRATIKVVLIGISEPLHARLSERSDRVPNAVLYTHIASVCHDFLVLRSVLIKARKYE